MKSLTLSPGLTPSLSIPHWLTLVLWFATAALTIGLFAVDQVTDYADLQVACDGGWTLTEDSPCNTLAVGAAEQAVLESWGLSLRDYANAMKLEAVIVVTVYVALALLLLWRKGDTRLGLMVSLALVVFPLNIFSAEVQWGAIHPALEVPGTIIANLTQLVIIPFFYLLPNGRLPTRWAYIPMTLTIALLMAGLFGIERLADVIPWLGTAFGIGMVSLLIIGAGLQIYRYVRTSDDVERQQTKWILGGILCFVISVLLWVYTYSGAFDITPGTHRLLVNVLGAWAQGALLCALPVAITIAILRYRLWNIDLIINRTLVFGILTAMIVVVYVLFVGGLGQLFQRNGNFTISLFATAVVAIAFQPARYQVQRGVNRLMFGQRDEPQAVLLELSHQLGTSLQPGQLLENSVETVAGTLRLPYAAIAIRHGDSESTQAEHGLNRTPLVSFPLIYQNEAVGTLIVGQRSPGETLNPADERVLTGIANQLGAVVVAVRLQTDLQQARERLVITREAERQRLRRDLHDGLGPALASLPLKIDAAIDLMTLRPEKSMDLLLEVKGQSQALVGDVREIVHNLRPPALDELGLAAALTGAISQTHNRSNSTKFMVDAAELPRHLPAAVESASYRIVMEAATNVMKHAHADHCWIQLEIAEAPSHLMISVADNGVGLPQPIVPNVGLGSMRERAEELGGTFSIGVRSEGGTRVRVYLPLTHWEEDAR